MGKDPFVRLTKVVLHNFKNVNYGVIDLNNVKNHTASVLGLYGQNGTGKTSLINVLSLLKFVLSGAKVPDDFVEMINIDSEFATLEFYFEILWPLVNASYSVEYSFKLGKVIQENTKKFLNVPNLEVTLSQADLKTEEKYKPVIYAEKLKTSFSDGNTSFRKHCIIDTDCAEEVFLPLAKYKVLLDESEKARSKASKEYAYISSYSYIFGSLSRSIKNTPENNYITILLFALTYYGNTSLIVIDTKISNQTYEGKLPIILKYQKNNQSANGMLSLDLKGTTTIAEDFIPIITDIITSMNVVLPQLIPNLKLELKITGKQTLKDNTDAVTVEVLADRGIKTMPLRYESEGIIKLISILHLLIVLYNKKEITVAIDELDAGIFEYLLGEILRIVSEKGKGQLIFTSHNLRPLETIDKNFIVFTTTDPNDRYLRLKNVQAHHNLRDCYYRGITLGGQEKPIYDYTGNGAITLAFRKAGEVFGD